MEKLNLIHPQKPSTHFLLPNINFFALIKNKWAIWHWLYLSTNNKMYLSWKDKILLPENDGELYALINKDDLSDLGNSCTDSSVFAIYPIFWECFSYLHQNFYDKLFSVICHHCNHVCDIWSQVLNSRNFLVTNGTSWTLPESETVSTSWSIASGAFSCFLYWNKYLVHWNILYSILSLT